MKVGVLALQGDFREHLTSLNQCGVQAIPVRRVDELKQCDALVLPGGESTTISSLARTFGIFDPIRDAILGGMPVYGSCAGMILLADRILDAKLGQETFGGIDITVRRNAFGRQIDSFESDISAPLITDHSLRAIFIRAPWVEKVGKDVEVLAEVSLPDGTSHPVAVRQGSKMATAFHPEISEDLAVHRYFLDTICK